VLTLFSYSAFALLVCLEACCGPEGGAMRV